MIAVVEVDTLVTSARPGIEARTAAGLRLTKTIACDRAGRQHVAEGNVRETAPQAGAIWPLAQGFKDGRPRHHKRATTFLGAPACDQAPPSGMPFLGVIT